MSDNTIAKLLIAIGVSVDGAKKASDEVDGATDSAANTDKKGSPKLKAFAKSAAVAFAAVGAAAVAATAALASAGGKLFDFTKEQTAAMDTIAKTAPKMGLSTDEYQRLASAAEHLGTPMEVVGKAIKEMNIGLAGGETESKKFGEALAGIGLSAEMLEGLTSTEKLGKISDAMSLVSDEAERTALSVELFGGKAGPGLANVLSVGSDGLRDLTDATVGVFSREDLAKAETFQDVMTDLNKMVAGVAGDLAIALAPAIQEVVQAVTEFVAENDDLIKQQLPKILALVMDNAVKLLPIVLELAGSVADLVVQAQPLIDQFLDFTSGAVEGGMRGVLSVVEALLPILMAMAGTVAEIVGSAETLTGLTKQGPRGAPKFIVEEKKEGIGEKSKKAAGEGWAKDRHLSETEIKTEVGKMIDSGQVTSFDAGVAQLKKDYDPVMSFAEMGQAAKAQAARDAANKPKPKKGGKAKPKTPEKVDASFGDYRDVLMTYQGKTPEESLKALKGLEQGQMPKDHRPETSITITNNMTYHIDVGGIEIPGAGSPMDVAKAVESHLLTVFRRSAVSTPNNIAR